MGRRKNIPVVQIPNPKPKLPFSYIITKTHTKVNDSDVLFIFHYFVTIKRVSQKNITAFHFHHLGMYRMFQC